MNISTDAPWTAGPWKIEFRRGQAMIIPSAPKPSRGTPFVIAHVGTNVTSDAALERRDANAHLIAAAPELFEQVLLLEKTIEYQIRVANAKGDDEGARLQAFTLHLVREVLAKAKGRAG